MVQIPTTIDEVDADWMAEALGQPITGVEHEQIGVGVGVSSAVYRSTLSGGDPATVITKLPALAEEVKIDAFTPMDLRVGKVCAVETVEGPPNHGPRAPPLHSPRWNNGWGRRCPG